MRLLAVHDNAELIGGGRDAAAAHRDLAKFARAHVESEHRFHGRVGEGACVDHRTSAAQWWGFFGRLKEKDHRARDLGAHVAEDLGGAHEDRHVHVVAAGVHDARFDPVVVGAHGGLEREVDLFGDRKRIHLGAQSNNRARLTAA